MDESTGDSGDEEGIGDSELDSVVERSLGGCKHGIEFGSLGNSSGESIKDETGHQLLFLQVALAIAMANRRTHPCIPGSKPIHP